MKDRQGKGLYSPGFEHDACGVGMVADMAGRPSRRVVEGGLSILRRLMHRGATGNDPLTGDGAGLLLQIPDAFFRSRVSGLPEKGKYAVAMVFGGTGEEKTIEETVREEGEKVIAWRDVPVDPSKIGPQARSVMPRIRQLFVTVESCPPEEAERRVFVLRRLLEKRVKDGYFCSFSSRTIVYKGLLLATQVDGFYRDLADDGFVSALALVHQRYSTNTFPSWPLAHPFRMLAHNGEINTLRGNLNALKAREKSLYAPCFEGDMEKILPLVAPGQSDSASLDNLLELLVAAGRDLPHAMLMLMPQAWGVKYHMGHDVRGFYEYHSALMEPWDGPAAVAFTDGISLGAMLDRNGLRPARWSLTKDGLFVLASEAGVMDFKDGEVARLGRLRPGSMIYLDIPNRRVMEDAEIKAFYSRKKPYRRWVEENQISVHGLFTEIVPSKVHGDLAGRQRKFGYTKEDLELVIGPMSKTGSEPVGSMGNDATLAALSRHPRSLFDFFHQLFAQVTNPPIDPIREELVMSLMTFIGNGGNLLEETKSHSRLIKLKRPVLTDDEMQRIGEAGEAFPSVTLSTWYGGSLAAAIADLVRRALEAVSGGAKIVILSDRIPEEGKDDFIPSLLATSAVNKALVEEGLRPSAGLIVQSGEVREVHHYAVLLGYGATAINPYLALETVSDLNGKDKVRAASNYIAAVDKGLLKIMSKMGISTLRSYRSSQIFEAVGLGRELVETYFPGTAARTSGLDIEDVKNAVRPDRAKDGLLDSGGLYRYRKDGEDHLWTPKTVQLFRDATRTGNYALFGEYSSLVNDTSARLSTLRSLFRFKKREPVSLDEVEGEEEIMKHFVGGAMSLGSLSPEAHETIAEAFNSLGLMSNSGEGGENEERFGTIKNCKIKQVASGRFGVTANYLVNASDLQIKLAQGAKPGEGGQLPAHKVDEFVGKLRHARPGTTLISPPPHHDIYSIEDLAQLIYDLHTVSPSARVSVKLVSEAGVGTIAAGVAKAHAEVVLISGYDGGTGAAPLTSMKHAGLPWELGLSEAQQTLVRNNLRSRVKLQVDGQLKTGRDIVVGAMLGAEEFGFGTTLLVALGCVQDRRCHCNTCPVGIATQDACLRKKFRGRKENIMNFLRFLARDVRKELAAIGLRSLDEAIGRSDLLERNCAIERASGFDFDMIFAREEGDAVRFDASRPPEREKTYDDENLIPLVFGKEGEYLGKDGPISLSMAVSNVHRSVGAALSGRIAKKYGSKGLPDSSVEVSFKGVGGQSFGAFLSKGVTFHLEGEANDYLGKGLSGGIISVYPPGRGEGFLPEDNVIAGNVIAYGGTSGEIYICGRAGERFAIRNSGVSLVSEGVGDHGCEYMTGGKVLILGETGVNFGAGMTGGVAYVLDRSGDFDLRCNLDSIDLAPVEAQSADEEELLDLLKAHIRHTSSPQAKRILDNWEEMRHFFVKVVPVRQ